MSLASGQSTTAFRVYGQRTFSTNSGVGQPVSSSSMLVPVSVASDSTGVYITDFNNNRVLFFSGVSTFASRVYGQQGSFASGIQNFGGISADSLNGPSGIAIASNGVYISDSSNNRVLFFPGTSTTATRVYGQQGSFTSSTQNNGGVSSQSLVLPSDLAVDATGIYVCDAPNHRVLFFSGTSTTASRVYGQQGSFTTSNSNKGGLSADSLNGPEGVAISNTGIFIADTGNNRVLFYPGTSTTASRVYGQNGNFTSNSATSISADSLNRPRGVTVNGTDIFVSDWGNNRVLRFSGTQTTANLVYGQGRDFTTATSNKGGISANSLANPGATAVDSSGLFISDNNNNRVLVFGATDPIVGNSNTTTTGSPVTSPPGSSSACFHETTRISYRGSAFLRLNDFFTIQDCHIPHVIVTNGVKIMSRKGKILRVTSDHLVFSSKGLMKAGDLREGDEIYEDLSEQQKDIVTSVTPQESSQKYFGLNCYVSEVLAEGIKTSTFGIIHYVPALWMKYVGKIGGIKTASILGDYIASAWNKILNHN